jgi:YD repeat-containing protein
VPPRSLALAAALLTLLWALAPLAAVASATVGTYIDSPTTATDLHPSAGPRVETSMTETLSSFVDVGAAPPPPPPRVSTFAYDGLGRLTSSSSPEGELNYAYAYPEPDGRLQVTTSGAISEVRNFDALGRVSNVRRGAGPLTSFTWNLGGTLASVSALGGWF